MLSPQRIKLLAGPLLGLLTYFLLSQAGQDAKICKTAGAAVFIAFWWITEAVNIYFTALLPIVLFPVLGVLKMETVAPLYMKEIIFLFIGGFLIAFALERWNLHKRIALKIILTVGSTPTRVLLGFMLSSYLLSMWILNTATVTMLLPALLAVIQQIEELKEGDEPTKLGTPLLLGLAYASSIGGIATLIGTAPNMVMQEYVNTEYSAAKLAEDPSIYTEPVSVEFTSWFAFGFPMSIVLFIACFLVLRFLYRKSFRNEEISLEYCRAEYQKLGKMSYEEKTISVYFLITILLWFFRKDIVIGDFTIPGLDSLPFIQAGYIKESTIAMLTACALFLHPAKALPKSNIITWDEVKKLPIGILFLFGGGFALAQAIKDSGLSGLLGEQLQGMGDQPIFLIILVLCLAMTFLTELTSNTASTILAMPLIFALGTSVDVHPLMLFVPITISASCAFMLPVATPPNTIAFGSEKLKIKDMMRAGIWLNLIAVAIISVLSYFLLGIFYG